MHDEQITRRFRAQLGTVILNYDTPEDTLDAVASVMRSSFSDQHIVVVDNNTSAEARAVLRAQVPRSVSYLTKGENVGYAAGNNLGIDYLVDGGVDYICVLNPDAQVLHHTIAGLMETAAKVPDAGIIGPRLLHGGSNPATVQSDGGLIDWERGGATTHVNGGARLEGLSAGISNVDYVTGACALLSRRMIEDIGTIPEDYFLYFEETEYALRAQRSGWASVVDRGVRATHFRRSTGAVPSRAYVYYMTRNRAIFAQRHLEADDAIGRAYADLDRTFLNPWAERINERSPGLASVFHEVVTAAKDHGRKGRTGRFADLDGYVAQDIAGWEN